MCYICEARGTAGAGYAATQALLARPWRPSLAHECWPCWGDKLDLTALPADRLWSRHDLWLHGKEWRREHLTFEGG